MRWVLRASLVCCFTTLAGCASVSDQTAAETPGTKLQETVESRPAPPGAPRLLLLISVDQLGSDLLARLEPRLDGGLARLLNEGTHYTAASVGHALTSTAPGHASLATGADPSRHGIVGNYWIDPESLEEIYSVEVEDEAGEDVESPERLLVTTLGDWLQERYSSGRVYAASSKDRTAVLLGGHRALGAFWYDDEDGVFESSEYYGDDPEWLENFDPSDLLNEAFSQPWTPRLPREEWEVLGIREVDWGPLRPRLPRMLGGPELVPGEPFFNAVYTSPVADCLLAAFALHLVDSVGLGDDDSPDLLALGFSALDAVGHTYGPHSPEVADTLLQLDRTLGELLTALEDRVGAGGLLVALSSDHGATAAPEGLAVPTAETTTPHRVGDAELACLRGVRDHLEKSFGEGEWVVRGPFFNRTLAGERGVDLGDLEASAVEFLEGCPSVARVWGRQRLLAEGQAESPAEERYRATFHPDRSPDLLVQWEEGFVPTVRVAATHGSVHPADSRVPIIVWGPDWQAGEVSTPVHTTSVPATLAAAVDVAAPPHVAPELPRP